jgi:hypothetical protein
LIVQLPKNLEHHAKQERDHEVHIVYIDDSRQDKIHDRQFQVMCAVIVADEAFFSIEQGLAYSVYERVSGELREDFEFHASDLLNGNKPFDTIKREDRWELITQAVRVVEEWKLPIVYGAVDLRKLYSTDFATANANDIAFRRCARAIEEWFAQSGSFGLLIADNTANQHVKTAMLNAFRQYRQFVRSSPSNRGLLAHIHDDMYFGDSKFSVGIQLADICTLMVSRHLVRYEDTEELYKRIEPLIFKGITES